MHTETIYDQIVADRRLVIQKHTIPTIPGPMPVKSWYCGYMQVLPGDDIWPTVQENSQELLIDGDPRFHSAIGGITWTGHLPDETADDEKFVGFDTAHWNMGKVDEGQVMTALQEMVKAINKKPVLKKASK